jgi:hypothetical protein
VFPSSSQQVPQDIPDITSILSHIVWTEFNFHVNCKNGSITKLLFSGVGAKGVLLLGTAHYSRKIGDGRNQCGLKEKKEKLWGTFECDSLEHIIIFTQQYLHGNSSSFALAYLIKETWE